MNISELIEECHGNAVKAGWWSNIEEGRLKTPEEVNVGEKLMLIVSEVAEAMEGHRKGLMDDKLKHRPMIEVELADGLIRIFDLAGFMKLDLQGAVEEKLEFNKVRPDHKIENRLAEGGKKY